MALIGSLGVGQALAAPVTLYGASQFSLHSQFTGQDYTIYLSVPEVAAPAGGYPVLYALDGDASFPVLHLANPRHKAVFNNMAQRSTDVPDPGVVVGIGYGRDFYQTLKWRTRDYTVPSDCTHCEELSAEHGGAPAFARFIAEELKPAIAARLPVNPLRQSLLGHSYGGLFTLYQMMTAPAAFERYFAISPSIWFGDKALTKLPFPAKGPQQLVLWVGEKEEVTEGAAAAAHPQLSKQMQRLQKNRMISNAREFMNQTKVWPGLKADFRVVPDHDHGEMTGYAYERVLDLAFAPDKPAVASH